ncbi:MAG: hypothetical protein H0X24_16905 [Ktedonobacterales bacterium]|nr:hypothetical protein [Ktedonobacterales bacterium]
MQYSTDPAKIGNVLLQPHYFQVKGLAAGTTYTYPWQFHRTKASKPMAIITYGYDNQQHTRLIAVGTPTGALAQSSIGGHTASGGTLPQTVTQPLGTATVTPDITCGVSCQAPIYTDYVTDQAYFDPVWIKLTEGKLDENCWSNAGAVYNCHGWWWAYWADDGWQLTSSSYSGPFYSSAFNQEWNWVELHFKHPWFCAGQATYVTYDPSEVRMGTKGYVTSAYSWSGASGACTWLLTSVNYG